MSMYTDPDHIRVEDPGKIEGNMVFHYLDVFGRPEDAQEIADMKEHYQRGGLGDVKTKRYLLEILERNLALFVSAVSNLLRIWEKCTICFKRSEKA